ncbi:MAG TPA: TonB-dependent receptor plug domain-containing protein [Opitutaceae bacterium]|nr:TonB-dependent receptor plug domain-containing protein [Opitutaceae bacterium]
MQPYRYRIAALTAVLSPGLIAQTGAPPEARTEAEDEVVILSPFEVTSEATTGYAAASTLAGNRLNSELRDLGSAVSVITSSFLNDVGATDNRTLLQYTTGSEVGGSYGNFAGNGDGPLLDESSKFISPNTNTRIRGLTSADNTRDFFLTDVPWDSYAVDGVDLQRGPNSILFGQGSPAGIINTRTKQAMFRNAGEASVRIGSYGANRQALDLNHVLLPDQLALRVAALRNDDQFKQEPAYSKDERLYGALRFEPAFLKKNGMRTILKANYEAGRVRSNNPRTLPPIDLITPWFKSGTYTGTRTIPGFLGVPATFNFLNRGTFSPAQTTDDNTGRPNHGQLRPAYNGATIPGVINSGAPNPYYNPWVGNFAQQFGGPMVFFDNGQPGQLGVVHLEPSQRTEGGLAPDGSIDRTIGGRPWMRPPGVAPYSQFARNAGLPFYLSGPYKNYSLTDSSVFDFYNQLLDGPNKKEWQDFRVYNLSLAQTFFDEQLGFELSYNNEYYKNGRLSLLSGGHQGIYVDINSMLPNGTPDGANGEPFANGTPNENVGRAFLSDNGQSNNSSLVSEKETTRLTMFASQDFEKYGKNWFTKLLGKHTVTGMFAIDEDDRDSRSWIRYSADDTYAEWVRRQSDRSPVPITDNAVVPNSVIYLGDSLKDRTTASGAYLPNPNQRFTVGDGSVYTFVGIWNRPTDPSAPGYVNPADPWINNYYLDLPEFNVPNRRLSTQSENPDNYVGWSPVPLKWVDSEASPENRAHNTTSARLSKSRISSNAFVWQGKFWNNSIVGTWGVRQDIAKSWTYAADSGSTYNQDSATRGVMDLSPNTYRLRDDYDIRRQVTSHSWAVVAHVNSLPGLDKLLAKSPINVSLFYNKSSNFQPAAARVDVYGDPLPAPTGRTTDRGILLETKDGRFSLKLNKYETFSENATSTALDSVRWFITASQVWGGNWANRFEFNLDEDWLGSAVPNPDPENTKYNYGRAGDETLEQAQARETAAVSAYRAYQASVDPRFYATWGLDLSAQNGLNARSDPANGVFAVPESSRSEGYEIELNAQVTRNWRLGINAAKTQAQRYNVGGAALNDFVARYETALNTTAAGDLRVWWGGAGNETTLYQWNANFGSTFHMLKNQEGTDVPELRKWRVNAITNYDFDTGMLAGFNVGAGVRYESSIVIGYPMLPLEGFFEQGYYDIAHPYRGDPETNFDFWIGYRRKIWKNVEWQIQLNVRNAFVGNELIPVTTQPVEAEGQPLVAGWRIRPPQTWQLTNTFRF